MSLKSSKNITFYGVLREVIILDYHSFKVLLFRCDWVGSGKNDIRVEDGLTLVNVNNNRGTHTPDPFILAKQAIQVFYSRKCNKESWSVVLRTPPRWFLDVDNSDVDVYSAQIDASILDGNLIDNDGHTRVDCDALVV